MPMGLLLNIMIIINNISTFQVYGKDFAFNGNHKFIGCTLTVVYFPEVVLSVVIWLDNTSILDLHGTIYLSQFCLALLWEFTLQTKLC